MFKSAFHPPSDYEKQWRRYTSGLHKRRLRAARPAIDTRAPRRFAHIQYKAKKERLQEERFTEIERENRILLEKMHRIMNGTRGGPRYNSTGRPQTMRQPNKPSLRQSQYDSRRRWFRPVEPQQLVARQQVVLDAATYLVEVFTEPNQVVIHVAQLDGPASYVLQLTRNEASALLRGSTEYERLPHMLTFEDGELILTDSLNVKL